MVQVQYNSFFKSMHFSDVTRHMSNMKMCKVNAACVFLCVRLVCLSLPDGCFSHSFVVLLSFGGDKSFMASRNGSDSGLYCTPDKMATSFEGKTYAAGKASQTVS